MIIPADQILKHIHPDATHVSVRTVDGSPCREFSIEELKVLIAAGAVIGIVRGNTFRKIKLTVSTDKAFRELGESQQQVKDALHSDANKTTLRDGSAWRGRRKHNNALCLGWNPAHFGWNGPNFPEGIGWNAETTTDSADSGWSKSEDRRNRPRGYRFNGKGPGGCG